MKALAASRETIRMWEPLAICYLRDNIFLSFKLLSIESSPRISVLFAYLGIIFSGELYDSGVAPIEGCSYTLACTEPTLGRDPHMSGVRSNL